MKAVLDYIPVIGGGDSTAERGQQASGECPALGWVSADTGWPEQAAVTTRLPTHHHHHHSHHHGHQHGDSEQWQHPGQLRACPLSVVSGLSSFVRRFRWHLHKVTYHKVLTTRPLDSAYLYQGGDKNHMKWKWQQRLWFCNVSILYLHYRYLSTFYSSHIYHLFRVRNCSSFSTVRLLDIRCLCPIKLTNDCIRKLYLGVVPRVAEISGWVKITLRIVSALPGRGRRQQPCGEREDYWIGGCPESTSLLLIPSGNLFFSLFFFKNEMLNIFEIMYGWQ